MFVSPISRENPLPKKAWDNLVVYDDGHFFAFFATGYKSEQNPTGYSTSLDVARSSDGVHWEFIARDQCFLEGAHAGYGVKKIGDYFYYYPTCSDHFKNETVHFKIFRTRDFLTWEYLGEQHDVYRDGRYYRARWEEMMIMDDLDEVGRPVMYGYISCENNPEYPPSAAMVKSYDGIKWEILPPVKIEWGETPSQHGEQNFMFKLDGRYYFSNTFRAYMDTYGFGAYTFVGDSPCGPFRPDLEMFRLCGNSRREVTWFSHYTHLPDGTILAALWLSHDRPPEIPSQSFAIGALKKYITQDGHLRLAYWEGTEAARGKSVTDCSLMAVYPREISGHPKDSLTASGNSIEITADRNGMIAMFNREFNREQGFIIEGNLTASESSQATHQHAVGAGFYFEVVPGEGIAMVPDTLGVTRSGKLRYADEKITDFDIYQHIGLVQARSGPLDGTLAFDYDDTVGPFGHASYCGIRKGRKHGFKLLARGGYFELYIDNLYVQTYLLPEADETQTTIRAGFCVFEGRCVFENIAVWEMSF